MRLHGLVHAPGTVVGETDDAADDAPLPIHEQSFTLLI